MPDFGAYAPTGSPVTDTALLQGVLDEAASSGGGSMRFTTGPNGCVFQTNAPLVVPSNVLIEVDPGVVIQRTVPGALLMNAHYGEDNFGYNGHGNIVVRGGVWDMNGTVVKDPNLGFAIAHGHDILFENLTIKDTPSNHACEINSSRRITFRNVKFTGVYLGAGDPNFLEALQIDSARTGAFGAFGAYDSTPCTDIVVENCYFGPSGTPGTIAHPRGIGTHSGWAGYEHTNLRIINNLFDGLSVKAIPMLGWERVQVRGNTFQNCAGGVYVDNVNGATVSNINIADNVFSGGSDPYGAIIVMPYAGTVRGVTISGNNLEDVGATGIRVDKGTDVLIRGNMLYDVGGNAIHVTGGADVTVWDNQIKGAGRSANATYYGIRVSSGTAGISVKNNRVRKYGSGNEILDAVNITTTCTGIVNTGNEV